MKTLSELMDRALDLDAVARAAWLDQLQNGPHAELLPHLRDMLARQADMETEFMARPAGIDVSGATTASIPPTAMDICTSVRLTSHLLR